MSNKEPREAEGESPETPETEPEEQEQAGEEAEGQEEQAAEQPPQEGQGQEGKVQEKKAILGKFKDAEALAGSYENLEKNYTRVSQELADTRRFLSELRNNQINLQRQIPQPQAPPEPVDWTNPDQAAAAVTRRELIKAIPLIVNQVQQINTARQIEAVRAQNPVEFERRAPIMYEIARQRPELNDDPRGAEKLFELAGKEIEKQSVASDPEKLVDSILPMLAKRLNITLDDAKKALTEEAKQRKSLGGLGGGKSAGPPKTKDQQEELVAAMEKYY